MNNEYSLIKNIHYNKINFINLLKINLLLIIMPHEPLSEDNTSCEEEVIKQRYKKNITIKENENTSLIKQNSSLIKPSSSLIKPRIMIQPNKNFINRRPIPTINSTTLLLLRK